MLVYDCMKRDQKDAFPPIICTVDVVLLCLQAGELQVLLHQRSSAPFAGTLALPGGYVHAQEDQSAADSAARVLRDKAGVASPYLEQLATFTGPARDPRGWSVCIAYFALVPAAVVPSPKPPGLRWVPVDRLPNLPFDHGKIVAQAVQRLRTKSQYSSLPVHLCGETFTLPQLQAVYEAVLGEAINKVSFRRKMDELGMLEMVKGAQEGGAHRPAQLWRLRKALKNRVSTLDRGLGLSLSVKM